MADDATIDALAKDIAGIESGGNYNALGPKLSSGDRAHGKYQIMGNNIPAWTEEAGLGKMTPQQFLASPDAQEKTARFQFNKLYDKYGNPQDVASVWHSGVPLAQAKAEGRKDVLGTTTASYASRVGGEAGAETPAPPNAPEEKVQLPDGTVVNLTGADDTQRAAFKQKVFAKWPELDPSTTSSKTTTPTTSEPSPGTSAPAPPAAEPSFRDTSVEEAGRQANLAVGAAESSPVGKYAAGALKPAYDAVVDFGRGVMKLPETIATFTQPSKIKDTAATIANLLHPLAVPAESAGNVAFQGLTDAGAPPEIAAGVATAVSLLVGAKTPLPGGRLAGASEKAAAKGAQATEAIEAVQPSAAAATRAREALTPAGVTAEQGGQAAAAGLERGLAETKEPVQGIYRSIETDAANAAKTVDPARYKDMYGRIAAIKEELGPTLTGASKDVLDTIQGKLDKAERLTFEDMANFKTQLDTLFPGKKPLGATPKTAKLYDYKWEVRNEMRDMLDGDQREWFDVANAMWRDQVLPKAKLTQLVQRTDPAVVIERLVGTGKTDKQAAMLKRVLDTVDETSGEAIRQAAWSRMLKTNAEGALDPMKLLKSYDDMHEGVRKALSSPGSAAFFKVLRQERGAAEAAADVDTGKLASFTASGLKFAAHKSVGPLAYLIPTTKIARALADTKTAGLLARAIKTPVNSAVVPTILRMLKNEGLFEEEQAPEEAPPMVAAGGK